jgi:lysozyme family protein
MTTTTALPTLSRGATGSDVQWAQYLLTAKTLDWNNVDGVFGPVTEQAVRSLQEYLGLNVDGVIGAQTWSALGGDQPRPPTLARGSEGQVVSRLQAALNEGRGAFAPETSPRLDVDGIFGPATEQAVRAVQESGQQVVNGSVGLQTWATWAQAGTATLASLCDVTAPTG